MIYNDVFKKLKKFNINIQLIGYLYR